MWFDYINGKLMPGEMYTGTGGAAYTEAANFAALPAATGSGDVVLVLASTGVWLINRKSAGFYKDTAADTWTFIGDYPVTAANIAVVPPPGTGNLPVTVTDLQKLQDEVDALVIEGVKPAGQIFLSAAGMWPSTTAGCSQNTLYETATNKENFYFMDFPYNTTKYAECSIAMPVDWDGSTVTATFYWTANSAVENTVTWALQGRAYANGDALDAAWGTEQSVTDTNQNAVYETSISAATAAITLAGTPAAGQLAQFRVQRTAGDTLNADARLIGVMIAFGRTP